MEHTATSDELRPLGYRGLLSMCKGDLRVVRLQIVSHSCSRAEISSVTSVITSFVIILVPQYLDL